MKKPNDVAALSAKTQAWQEVDNWARLKWRYLAAKNRLAKLQQIAVNLHRTSDRHFAAPETRADRISGLESARADAMKLLAVPEGLS